MRSDLNAWNILFFFFFLFSIEVRIPCEGSRLTICLEVAINPAEKFARSLLLIRRRRDVDGSTPKEFHYVQVHANKFSSPRVTRNFELGSIVI